VLLLPFPPPQKEEERLTSLCDNAALPASDLASRRREVWDVQSAEEIAVSPVLLNRQDTTRFCLARSGRNRYSQAIHINTVGEPLPCGRAWDTACP
jgi:hypothetical protein